MVPKAKDFARINGVPISSFVVTTGSNWGCINNLLTLSRTEHLRLIYTAYFFLIATAILLIVTDGLHRTQWKCSHYATATTSPIQPIINKNKLQSHFRKKLHSVKLLILLPHLIRDYRSRWQIQDFLVQMKATETCWTGMRKGPFLWSLMLLFWTLADFCHRFWSHTVRTFSLKILATYFKESTPVSLESNVPFKFRIKRFNYCFYLLWKYICLKINK